MTFSSRDADLLDGSPTRLLGWLFRPAGAGPFPAIVALHGCGGLYARRGDLVARHRDWAERLARQGYVVLFPDSFTPRAVDEICTRAERSIRPERERVADAYGALEYLQGLPFVRADRIALLGWSNGGSTVLAAVTADATARPAGLPHDFRTAVAFYPGCGTSLRDRRWFPVVPVQILIGGSDDWTPATSCRALGERIRSGGARLDVAVFDGAFHGFDDPSTPVRVRRNIATTRSGTATVGTDPTARAAAISLVEALLQSTLRDPR